MDMDIREKIKKLQARLEAEELKLRTGGADGALIRQLDGELDLLWEELGGEDGESV